ncbi:hypothetical protein DYI24_00130 [Rhodopseudomonas sp. BR0C11]|uniref:hypothetical protein n=1 Tax=Rhodopseudomonas sp. BR0C11 TaxID=2269370 RepID=UPI0013DEC2F0|nr:hypothetical protein [Rhodopseudomonas sp. BR0C11]NEV75488.1 hypothetical protein [Rhodopseudomonas sp. BR0C11]
MHAFINVETCGHIYGPGGRGEIELDPAAKICGSETIVHSRELPGFVEDRANGSAGVTYESHRFSVHFLAFARGGAAVGDFCGVLVRVHHGAGWELWRGDDMLADALWRYGDDDRGLFKLCWYMIDAARAARGGGAHMEGERYRRAFVDGRLRKRKLPSRGAYRVWIDPERPAPTADSVIPAFG